MTDISDVIGLEAHASDGFSVKSPPTAASAAVLQVPVEPFFAQDLPVSGAAHTRLHDRIVRHPSAALYDAVFNETVPLVGDMAARKKIVITPDEYPPLARYALERVSRRTMCGVLKLNTEALVSLQMAISHALDVFAAMRVVYVMMAVESLEATHADTVLRIAEQSLHVFMNRSANDRAPFIQIWPDPVAMATRHFARIAAEAAEPPVILPDTARVLCSVQRADKKGPAKRLTESDLAPMDSAP